MSIVVPEILRQPANTTEQTVNTNNNTKAANNKTMLPRVAKNKQNSVLMINEINYKWLTLNEYGLVVTVTSKLLELMEKFKDAMITEVQVLENLDVWEEVDAPSGTSVIGVK